MPEALQRNKKPTKGSGLRRAAAKAQAAGVAAKSYDWPIKAPDLLPGVAPAGVAAPVMAADSPAYTMAAQAFPGGGFPGFAYLSQLATRAEYRQMASGMATELTREWIEFSSKQEDGDDSSEKIKAIEEEFKRLEVRGVIQQAASDDCFFGRGQIFMNIDGADRKTPLILDPRTVKKGSLQSVTTVEAIWTTPATYNALDPVAPDFYKPTKWFMLGQEVHASRLMTVVTRPLPDILKPAFNFAGMSLSQLAEPYVDNWLRTRQSVSDLLNNFSITALATSMDQVLQGDDDGSDLFARATLFTATRSNKGLMLLDKEREELVQINTPLSGLHELQAQSQEHMCSVSRMPAIVLTGISPSGLNASSEGEIRIFYDWIAAQQEAHWRSPLEVILKVVQLSLFGEIDPDIGFKFVPLYQMTAKEEAEIREANSRTATAYIDRGVIDASEERERLARDPNSGYQGIDTDAVIVPPVQPGGEQPPGGLGDDKSVSEAQHRAMEAAAHGHSTLGIPKKVGEEFVAKDAEFKESEHPRKANGQFGSGGGGSSSGEKGVQATITAAKESPEIKQWGGDELITDDDGAPIVFVHDSDKEIESVGSGGRYGGLFALADKNAGYGAVQNSFVAKGEMADSQSIESYVNSLEDGGKSIVERVLRKELTDDEVERAVEIAVNEEASDDQDDLDLMGSIDLPDMFADMQRLRVELAKAAGASVVKMEDENGASYVLLPSDNVKNVKSFGV